MYSSFSLEESPYFLLGTIKNSPFLKLHFSLILFHTSISFPPFTSIWNYLLIGSIGSTARISKLPKGSGHVCLTFISLVPNRATMLFWALIRYFLMSYFIDTCSPSHFINSWESMFCFKNFYSFHWESPTTSFSVSLLGLTMFIIIPFYSAVNQWDHWIHMHQRVLWTTTELWLGLTQDVVAVVFLFFLQRYKIPHLNIELGIYLPFTH